ADGAGIRPRVQPSGTADVSIHPLTAALRNAPSLRVTLGRSRSLLDLSRRRWQEVAPELRRGGPLDGGGAMVSALSRSDPRPAGGPDQLSSPLRPLALPRVRRARSPDSAESRSRRASARQPGTRLLRQLHRLAGRPAADGDPRPILRTKHHAPNRTGGPRDCRDRLGNGGAGS